MNEINNYYNQLVIIIYQLTLINLILFLSAKLYKYNEYILIKEKLKL